MSSASILFLQGPLGPFFRELAKAFSDVGYTTHKINFNGGDRFYSGADMVSDYTGTVNEWPVFLESYLQGHQIQSVFLLGDCRLYHRLARPVCERLGVAFMVFEEGYVRPDTITLELNGVNALSQLDLSPESIHSTGLVTVKAPVSIGPTMKPRAIFASLYYWASFFGQWRFRHYVHHRAFNPVREGFCWVRSYARKQLVKRSDKKIHRKLCTDFSGKFVLVPLQVHDDSQKIYHSSYRLVERFIEEVVRSFAQNAAAGQVLCFKHHPMDRGYTHYGRVIGDLAFRFGLEGRVFYCHDNSLPELYRHAFSVVTVNSSVGLSALLHNIPVKTMGKAMYDIEGLTHQGSLDSFWQNPQPVDIDLFARFHSRLYQMTQINGSFFKHWELSCHNALEFYQALYRKSYPVNYVPVLKPESVRDNPLSDLKAA